MGPPWFDSNFPSKLRSLRRGVRVPEASAGHPAQRGDRTRDADRGQGIEKGGSKAEGTLRQNAWR